MLRTGLFCESAQLYTADLVNSCYNANNCGDTEEPNGK